MNNATILTDAAAGALPAFSIVTPTGPQSQHNGNSMIAGDNWIGQVVSAITSGPQWASTAVFITYDDCGCFYDHVPPPEPGMGIRVPMVIVSPYARRGFTDSNVATYASLLAFAEGHTWAQSTQHRRCGTPTISRRPSISRNRTWPHRP